MELPHPDGAGAARWAQGPPASPARVVPEGCEHLFALPGRVGIWTQTRQEGDAGQHLPLVVSAPMSLFQVISSKHRVLPVDAEPWLHTLAPLHCKLSSVIENKKKKTTTQQAPLPPQQP